VSSVGESAGRPPGRMIGAVVAGIIALLFIVAGFIYVAEPAKSLPSIMGHVANSNGHHPLRAAGCLIVGVVLAIGAWFILNYKPKARQASTSAKESSPAGRS
jgi:protein-S-isoprenylcysteine O-methyltransferase Ste14